MSATRRLFGFGLVLAAALPWFGPTASAMVDPPPPAPLAIEQPPTGLSASPIPLEPPLPASAVVTDFLGHAQSLPLSCESRSAVDWAGFFGVFLNELEFFHALPVSSDPDLGFVGDVRGAWGQLPPNAYGVHAGPVARLLQAYGVSAYNQLYLPWPSLQAEIAAGRPVMVWVTGHVQPGLGQQYTAPDGHRTVVAPYEHTVIVVGYDDDSVTIEDEGRQYHRPLAVFLAAWGALRQQAITANP
jgi:uncharacterized protein YvpB